MKRNQVLSFALALLPFIIGAGFWVTVFRLQWVSDYLVYARISLGVLALIAGTTVTACLLPVILSNISQNRRHHADLRSIEEKDLLRHRQFLMRLDHELKNPLTALQVETANLDAVETQDPDLLASIVRMKTQITRLYDLLIPLRKLAEIDTLRIEAVDVDMSEMLMEVASELRSTQEGKVRRINVSLPELPWPLPAVRGDGDLLYLAIHNIAGNAVKYTRPGDTVQIRAYENEGMVIVEVADTGPGIPAEETALVWEELFRGKLARGKTGSGLGLSLAKAIVEKHGGSVSLQSRVEQGTVVTVRLPSGL